MLRAFFSRSLFNPSHIVAGFIAVLVGYTSSAVIIFQAAEAAGASPDEISSWLWALGIGMGITSIGLSLRYRSPILIAWSTPGGALLATGLPGFSLNEAIGVFLFNAALITLCGLFGWFDRIMRLIPASLAGAMLAGVLLPFGLHLFVALEQQTLMVGAMLITYLLGRQLLPRYVVPLALLAGVLIAALGDQLHMDALDWTLAQPVWTAPAFSLTALIGVGIPMFIVTMASQNVPGMAVLRANGYQVPASPLMTTTGITGLLLAPFGGYTFNLAAISAAICAGKDADPDPAQRYRATIWGGLFYLLTGLFGATVASLFAAFPQALIMAIAGLALLGTIGNSLATALHDESQREAAFLTFLVTASGLSLLGIGSAFWGLVLGMLVLQLARRRA